MADLRQLQEELLHLKETKLYELMQQEYGEASELFADTVANIDPEQVMTIQQAIGEFRQVQVFRGWIDIKLETITEMIKQNEN